MKRKEFIRQLEKKGCMVIGELLNCSCETVTAAEDSPLKSGTIQRILSGSSLDHFPDKTTAVAHALRVPAIRFSVLVERVGWKRQEALAMRILDTFEALKCWPTRYWTGYYLAIRAEKTMNALDTSDSSRTRFISQLVECSEFKSF